MLANMTSPPEKMKFSTSASAVMDVKFKAAIAAEGRVVKTMAETALVNAMVVFVTMMILCCIA